MAQETQNLELKKRVCGGYVREDTYGTKILKVLAHGGVFFEEEMERLGRLVGLRGDKESLQEPVGAKTDVGYESSGLGQALHRQRHLLRWRLRRRHRRGWVTGPLSL